MRATGKSLAAAAVCALHAPPITSGQILGDDPTDSAATGARALGMGGAFVALADDATATEWNPAGLAQLNRAEATLVWRPATRYRGSTPDYRYEGLVHGSGKRTVETGSAGSYTLSGSGPGLLAMATPVRVGPVRAVAQFGIQRASDANLRFRNAPFQSVRSITVRGSSVTSAASRSMEDALVRGGVDAYALTLAARLGSRVSLGAAVNLRDGAYRGRFHNTWQGGFSLDEQYRGWRAHVGLLAQAARSVRIGVAFKSAFDLRNIHHAVIGYEPSVNLRELPLGLLDDTGTRRIREPWELATGLAYVREERWRLSADVTLTRLSRATFQWQGLPIQPTYPAGTGDDVALRMGAEHVIAVRGPLDLAGVPVRAGLFRHSSPNGTWGWSVGIGLQGRRVAFDVAYLEERGERPWNSRASTSPYSDESIWFAAPEHMLARKVYVSVRKAF